MKIETRRFGEVDVPAQDLVTFPEGLPGFQCRRYVLLTRPGAERVCWLQSAENSELAMMTVSPSLLGFEYEPRIKPAETLILQTENLPDLEIRLIAAEGPDGGLLLNLFAPLLIHRKVGLAKQVPLVGSGHSPVTPWPAPIASDNLPQP